MKEPLSPPIQLPISYHRHAKSWAARHGCSLRDAVVEAIKTMCGEAPPLDDGISLEADLPGIDPRREG